MQRLNSKQYPIPPSIHKNTQSLTNNAKPYHSNNIHGRHSPKNQADQYNTNYVLTEPKIEDKTSPINELIQKDQTQTDEYQIDLNTPQFQELMGFKQNHPGSPQIEQETEDLISDKSLPKMMQYQNSGITFKDAFIPRGDSLMSENSKQSLNTLMDSHTSKTNQRSDGFSIPADFNITSTLANQRSPTFQPDMSGSGMSPEVHLKQFLTPESATHLEQRPHFQGNQEYPEFYRSDEFFIEDKHLEGKGSNFSGHETEHESQSGADISLECTAESLNFGLHMSPDLGVGPTHSKIPDLSEVSGNQGNI